MTGDDRLVNLTADPTLISASTSDTPATLKERPNSQRMREKEDETLHDYLLRELTIDSVNSGNWDNISEISLNPVPASNGYNRSSVWIHETASVTPTNHLTPLKTFSIETSDKYSSCNQNIDVVKRRQPVLTRSEIFVESSTFHPEKYVLNNSPTNPNNDTANQNSNNGAKTPSIYSISSSILNISSLASPTRDSNKQRVDSHGVALFSNLRVGGAKPASLRKVNFSPKDASSEPTKAVTFRSDFSDSVASNSHTFVGSGNDLTQSPKPSILKIISPTNLRKSPDNICLEYQETAPQHEVNDRSAVREIRKTNAATRVSLDKEHETAIDSDVVVRTGLLRCANLSTQKGRRNHALMIMLVSVIPVIALLIQNSIGVYNHSLELQQHSAVKGEILFSVEIGNLLHRTQIERGTTALYVSSKGDATILQNLTTAYRETDKVISNLTRWVVEPNISYFQSVESYHARLKDFRSQVLSIAVPNMTVPQVIKFYSDDNAIIVRWVGQVIQHSKSGDLWKTLVGYYMLILSKEQAGVERALGSTFYAKGGYDNQEMLGYLERKILGMTYLERCTEYSTSVNILLKNVFIGKETDINLQRMRSEILRNALNGSDVVMGAQWFNNMTKYINILKVTMASTIPKLLTFLVVQLVIVDVSAKTAIQCLEGVNKTMVPLFCGNQYIDIKNVSVGTPTRKSGCDIDSTNDVCCNQSNACLYPNTTSFKELSSWCFQRKSCDIPLWAVASIAQSCNSSVYQLFATFMVVDYECVDTPQTSTTTPTMPSASTVAMPMTTSFYSNNLTMGEQAAIICCIMLFIVLIGTAVVIYKRIKYGPPEDFRKLFSKPPENPGNDSPGMTPWLPGEAQEQVYQKMAETQKKKKRKFPKFKF